MPSRTAAPPMSAFDKFWYRPHDRPQRQGRGCSEACRRITSWRSGQKMSFMHSLRFMDETPVGRPVGRIMRVMRMHADATDEWAIQAQNTPPVSTEKQHVSKIRAAKSAVEGGNPDFAAALAMIAALPLTPAEKADAVRRLLAGKGVGK